MDDFVAFLSFATGTFVLICWICHFKGLFLIAAWEVMDDGRWLCVDALEKFAARGKALLNVLTSLHIGLDHFNDLFLLLFVTMSSIYVRYGMRWWLSQTTQAFLRLKFALIISSRSFLLWSVLAARWGIYYFRLTREWIIVDFILGWVPHCLSTFLSFCPSMLRVRKIFICAANCLTYRLFDHTFCKLIWDN